MNSNNDACLQYNISGLTVGKWPSDGKRTVVETRAGVRDLTIVLDPGPSLFLRIVGYVPGFQVGTARVLSEDPDGTRDVRYAPIRDDGSCQCASSSCRTTLPSPSRRP